MTTFIIDQLVELYKQDIVSFHMPGHKNGRIFKGFDGKGFMQLLPALDTTEIPGTDNLHKPTGVIKEAQIKASEIFKSDETYFLVNGSTSGIYSMVMAATEPGDKVIVNRNCHQSVINATILGKCTPVFINPEVDIQQGIALGVTPEAVEVALKANPEAKAVVITYPTYHGIACDLKKIRELVHKYDKILLVDEAHGAHFGLSQQLPPTALECGADVVVQSTHKTLPSFTQSSMLHIQGNRIDKEKLRFMLRLHQSSSPSYLLLASLDLAVKIYEEKGKSLMERLLEEVADFNDGLKKYDVIYNKKINIGHKGIYAIDPTKIWISLQHKSITGYQLEKRLREGSSIQLELSNIFGALAIATIGNTQGDFDRLFYALQSIAREEGNSEIKELPIFNFGLPIVAYTPYQAIYMAKDNIPLDESEGHVSGDYIIPYPPGIPLLIPGEVISKEIIKYIRVMQEAGMNIVGINEEMYNTIAVLK